MQRDLKTKESRIKQLEEDIENKTMSLQISLDQAKAQLTSKDNELARIKSQLTNAGQDAEQTAKAMQEASKVLSEQNEKLKKELLDLQAKHKQEQAAFEATLTQMQQPKNDGQVAELQKKIQQYEQDKAMKEMATKQLLERMVQLES
jgi:chromosome segregation ATPase